MDEKIAVFVQIHIIRNILTNINTVVAIAIIMTMMTIVTITMNVVAINVPTTS